MNRGERRRRRSRERGSGKTRPPALSDLLEAAAARLGAGHLDEATALLDEARRRAPGDTDVLHLSGVAAYRQGRAAEAAELIGRAAAARPGDAALHANHAAALNLAGRLIEAEQAAKRAVALDAASGEAHNNLGLALELQGRLNEAAAAYRRAIEIRSRNAQAQNNLGNVLRRLGHIEAAVAAYREAVAAAPAFAAAYANLGAALRDLGDVKDALAACRRAVGIDPAYAPGHNALGTALTASGDREEAAAAHRRAWELDSGLAAAGINLGAALYALERLDEAEAAYRSVLERFPALADGHNGLGVVLLAAGRLEEALACFRAAVAACPNHVEALYNLASARAGAVDGPTVARMEAMVTDAVHPPGVRARLHFALGEVLDAAGDADAAFGHVAAGNRLRHDELPRHGHAFDAGAHERWVKRIATTFTPALFASRQGFGIDSETPVFIIGMPRSGTTLVESIVAGHPQVVGGGERDDVAQAAARLRAITPSRRAFPEGAADMAGGQACDLANACLAGLTARAPDAARVTDKTPQNFLYLGLIQVLLPRARVIHCVRDARDTCVSCFFQDFAAGQGWSTDLVDLGRYFRAYARLMEHWRGTLSLAMIEVGYEDLVAAPEEGAKRVIAFLGLPWDDACLAFHTRPRPVRTAASWQVRRPVYRSSVERWRAYERHLGPLTAALAGGARSD